MNIDTHSVKVFLGKWLLFFVIITGIFGGLALMCWTMILGGEYFGDIGWIAVMIVWVTGGLAGFATSIENEHRKMHL